MTAVTLLLSSVILWANAMAIAQQNPIIQQGPIIQAAPRPAATPTAIPAAASNSLALAPNYHIGAQDVLQVTVWKEPANSGTLPVRPDGQITLPFVGDIVAAGKTPQQLSDDITERLKKYLQSPLVTVAVVAVNSQKIFLVGEIGRVGEMPLTPAMTPLQAIASSGGLTAYAKAKNIYILRGDPGKQTKIPFNYKKALKGEQGTNLLLQPGDTIVVP